MLETAPRHSLALAELLDRIEIDVQLQDALGNSEIVRQIIDNAAGICQNLADIRRNGNLENMVRAEAALLSQHVDLMRGRTPIWQEESNSLNKAQREMAEGWRCLDNLMHDIGKYNQAQEIYNVKARDGYPQDAFRTYCGGQHTRLSNSLKSPYSDEFRMILKARDDNVLAMQKKYIEHQREKLPEPAQTVGTELAKYQITRVGAIAELKRQREMGIDPKSQDQAKRKKSDRGIDL
ncbi:MAG: hypothetical protein LBP33_03925 [Candidatus Adiutrix sp.]|jgi:hypothetical protein|nr:hypothetical protein [Candidatus Adiutrix sp.]